MNMFTNHHVSAYRSYDYRLPSDATIIHMDTPNSYGLINSAFDHHDDTVLDLKCDIEVHGTV